jgi:D-tyrosyl-tRNA(Tyr) deacylase
VDYFEQLPNKIVYLRMFEDENKKMNYSLLDINGEALIISQFTLLANLKKGRRPSFEYAAKPDKAKALYEKFVEEFSNM